jgi:hypothetical protein
MSLRETIREALDTASGTPAREMYQFLLQVERRLGPHNDGLLLTYMREASEAMHSLMCRVDQEPSTPEEP